MLKSLFLDFFLGLLILAILSRFYTSSYAAPFTTYGGSAILGLSQVSWRFVLSYGLIIFIVNVLVGVGFTLLHNYFYSGTKLLDILLIFLLPNLIFYIYTVLQSLKLQSLPYLSRSDNYITYFGQIGIFIEHTTPLIVGGLIALRLLK